MTYSTFVGRPALIKDKISQKIEDVQFKWTVCLNTVPELGEKVQSSIKNTTESSIIRYSEAKEELDELMEKYDEVSNEVSDFFYRNLKREEADVLYWKYCAIKSIGEIAKIKCISYSGAASKIYRADRKAEDLYYTETLKF